VNNASTDGTKEYLTSLNQEKIVIINEEKNSGASGGFNIGIKQSMQYDADWTWVMDDDTIPFNDALEKLMLKSNIIDKVGFLSSRVVFSDGEIHKMNIISPVPYIHNIAYNQYIEEGVLLTNFGSFVSILIKQTVIKQVGYPISDFYIWCTDVEYTKRIAEAGFWGIFAFNSNVWHKTKNNYEASIKDASLDFAWRYYYNARNQTYIIRKYKESHFSCFRQIIFNTIRDIFNCLKRKESRFTILSIVLKGRFMGLFFNPKIEKYDE
jgi:GT2 family glycosyltransferase